MSNPTNDGAAAAAVPATPAAGAPGAPTGAPATPAGSAFAAVTPAAADGAAAPAAPAPLLERIPEKYRVTKDDGTLDLEASASKLADGHIELQKSFGARESAPKTPEDYAPKVEGFDFAELKDDPQYQSFLKGAHARGVSNDTLSWILDEYLQRDLPSAGMSAEELKAEMTANTWKAPGEYDQQMQLGLKAIRAFAPDITAEELNGIPNHPMIARILAKVGAELGEDTALRVNPMPAADFDTAIAQLQVSDAFNNASHPEHGKAIAQYQELFNKRYPPGRAA